jgi:hypothetical protein
MAAELDLAGHLREGGKDGAELAAFSAVHAWTLDRLLEELAGVRR